MNSWKFYLCYCFLSHAIHNLNPYTESRRPIYLTGSKISILCIWITEKHILNLSKGSSKENATQLLVMISHTSLQQLSLHFCLAYDQLSNGITIVKPNTVTTPGRYFDKHLSTPGAAFVV